MKGEANMQHHQDPLAPNLLPLVILKYDLVVHLK